MTKHEILELNVVACEQLAAQSEGELRDSYLEQEARWHNLAQLERLRLVNSDHESSSPSLSDRILGLLDW